MNKVLEFPKHKIVREIAPKIAEVEEAKEKGKQKFADEIVYDLIGNIHDALESYGIDTETNDFDKDYSVVIDMLRATVYRSMGIKHHLHSFIDKHVSVVKIEKDGKIIDIEDGKEYDDIILEEIDTDGIDKDL